MSLFWQSALRSTFSQALCSRMCDSVQMNWWCKGCWESWVVKLKIILDSQRRKEFWSHALGCFKGKGKILWAVVKYERFSDLLEHKTKQKSMEAFKKVIAQNLQTEMLDLNCFSSNSVLWLNCDWASPSISTRTHTHSVLRLLIPQASFDCYLNLCVPSLWKDKKIPPHFPLLFLLPHSSVSIHYAQWHSLSEGHWRWAKRLPLGWPRRLIETLKELSFGTKALMCALSQLDWPERPADLIKRD